MGQILAWLAVILTGGFVAYGVIRHGLSWETQERLWRDVIDRSHGPMTFRFILQPVMAAIAATHDGMKDARLGRAPYLRTILHDPNGRGERLRDGLVSIARIILLGFAMDAIYQWRVLGTFYPGEAVVITLILAVLPYLVLRGPITRIARWWLTRRSQPHSHG
jgi:hypothetical protein